MKIDILSLSPSGFRDFLHERIPPARFLGIEVLRFDDDEIRMRIPLNLNNGDRATAFAGSINSLLTLCGWSRVLRTVRAVDPEAELAIGKSAVTFRRQLSTDPEAVCGPLPADSGKRFLERYSKEGKAKIKLLLAVDGSGDEGLHDSSVLFSGTFVACRNQTVGIRR